MGSWSCELHDIGMAINSKKSLNSLASCDESFHSRVINARLVLYMIKDFSSLDVQDLV